MKKTLKWKKRINKTVNVICAIMQISLTALFWLCLIAIYYVAELLSFVGGILIAQLEGAIQKESDRIQCQLERNHEKAILKRAKNIVRGIKRGQKINKKKERRGDLVFIRHY